MSLDDVLHSTLTGNVASFPACINESKISHRINWVQKAAGQVDTI